MKQFLMEKKMTDEGQDLGNERDRDETPVIVNFGEASIPKTDFARDLMVHWETLAAAGNADNLKFAAQGGAIIYNVNPYFLAIKDGWNMRDHTSPDNVEHVRVLAGQIAASRRVEEPLTVHLEDSRYWIINGHCRFLAVMHAINVLGAEVMTVPIKLADRLSTRADRISMQIVGNSGKPLTPLEAAGVYRELKEEGWTEKKIADKAGISRRRVVQLLDLYQGTTKEIEKMISEGEVTSSFVARVLKSAGSSEAAEEVLVQAIEVAKKAGKKRASAKHLPKPAKPKVVIQQLVETPENVGQKGRATPTAVSTFAPEDDEVQAFPGFDESSSPVDRSGNKSRKLAQDIFRQARINEDDEMVTMTMPADAYLALRRLLGLPI